MKALEEIKASYSVVDSVKFGDGESHILEVKGVNFATVFSANGVTIYKCFRDPRGKWVFASTSKAGKSAKVVHNFIKARIKG